MSSVGAEGMLLEAGKSPELDAAFRIVAEAECAGAAKFSPGVSRKLARIIVCRCYAPAVLELCHLVGVAKACSTRRSSYEGLFWDSGPARAAGFRGFIGARLRNGGEGQPRISASDSGVEIVYADGSFGVAFARMPLLSALMEFLVTVLGYRALDDALQVMLEQGPTAAAVSDTAKHLSRALYGFLNAHLPSAQTQRNFNRLTDYLVRRHDGDFDETAIDDEAILGFWLAESAAETPDFRTFLSVFRSFVRLRQALILARDRQALAHPRAIGPDREAGEIDPAELQIAVEALAETEDCLTRLRETAARRIKFLTKTEAAELEGLVEHGSVSRTLALSLLRSEVFGAVQTRISQALRRRTPVEALRGVIDGSPAMDYESRRVRLAELRRHVERVLLATVHVLLRARRWEALTIAVALRPDIDLRPFRGRLLCAGEHRNVVALTVGKPWERLLPGLEDPSIAGPAMASLMQDARQAFKSLARQGFREDEARDPEVVEGFVAAIEPLLELERELSAFGDHLSRVRLPQTDWQSQFEADRQTFRSQFLIIYGVRNDQHLETLHARPTRRGATGLRSALGA
ncbi:MAG: hypothetical protein QNJ30_06635 [Kiloniellales bacterium]|nr:hypothetical protein [Kiloniellales bacterium]